MDKDEPAIHEFALWSDFCIHCGIGMKFAGDHPEYECTRATNIKAISHLRHQQRFHLQHEI